MTTLTAGQIGFVSYNTDGTDGFSFVLLTDITAGTVINFTDQGWTGSAFAINAGDSTAVYTAPTNLAAGTVISSTSTGFVGSLNLDSAGDQIIAYQGTAASPTFISAINLASGSNSFAGNAANANNSALPTGLTLGTNAIAVAGDNAAYVGPTAGAAPTQFQATVTSTINNINEWVQNDNSPQTLITGPFFVAPDRELFVADSGGGNGITHISYDGSVGSGALAYDISTIYQNSAGGTTFHPSDIVLDTVHDKYFIADSDGTNDRILQGSISQAINNPGVTPTYTVLYTESAAFDPFNKLGIVALTVDPNHNQVFFAEGNDLQRINYDTAGQSATTLGSIGTSGQNFDQDMAIDFTHGTVFITDGEVESVFGSDVVNNNRIWEATGLTSSSTANSLTFTQLPFSPNDSSASPPNNPNIAPNSGNALPVEDGVLRGIDIDPITQTLYFTTSSVSLDTSALQDGSQQTSFLGGVFSYHVTGNATGTYTEIYHQNGSTGPLGELYYITVDPNTGRYYLSDPTGGPSNGDEGIWIGNTAGGTPSNFTAVSNINGLAPEGTTLDTAPTLSITSSAATFTESTLNPQSANVTRVSVGSGAAANDVDSADQTDQLAGATAAIANGTFFTGDQLTIGGNTSGTLDSGKISFSYNSANGVMTFTGDDTFAAYQNALNSVQFGSTSENPTNYGNDQSRTLTYTVTDGLLNSDPATTSLTVVGTDDAPVNNGVSGKSGNEDTQIAITGLSVTDVDADPASQAITVDLSVLHGTITVATNVGGGLIAAGVANNGTSHVTLTGTQNAINATLASATGVEYQGNLNFNTTTGGAETLTILSGDQGFNGTGGPLTDSDNLSITVNPVNDSPVLSNVGPSATVTEQITATLDPDVAVSDVDLDPLNGGAGSYTGASLTIARNGGASADDTFSFDTSGMSLFSVSGGNLQSGGLTFATFTSSGGTLTLNFTSSGAQATTALVNDVIDHIQYTNTSDDPPANVTLNYSFNDGSPGNNQGSGATGIATGSTLVTINAVNDAPAATITPASYSATEQINLNLRNNGLSVSDVDGESGNETVTLSVTEGTLTLAEGTSGVTIDSGNGTNSVTFHGTIAQLNDLLNTNATSSVVYNDITDTPSSSATLTLAINDNGNTGTGPVGGLTNQDTATINITAVNDAPVAAMTMDPYTATEQTTLDLKNTGMSVSDVDALGAVETATLSVGEGTLHVDPGTSGALVSNDNTSSVTITGTIAQINAALNTDLTSAVTYIDNTDNPSASANLTLQINDGGNTGSPPPDPKTGSDTSTINITAVNDAPVASITPTEYDGQPGTSINLKNTLSVSDVDGNAGSETVTLSATSGTLSVTAGTSGALVTNSGTSSVTITGTVAQINALLTSDATSTVSYVDSAGGLKTLTLLIHDNGNTGTGGDKSSQDTALILLDEPPSLGGAGNTVTYTEQQTPVVIDDQITLSDVDAPGAGNQINSATVKITVGALTGDLLAAVTTGTNITATFNGTDTLTLSGPDTIANYQQVLRSVTFASTSDDPTLGGTDTSRTVTWVVNDIFDVPSTAVISTVDVTAVNDAPAAAITPTSYSATEQTALNLKGTGLAVSDVDGDNAIETATLSVTEGTLTVTAGTSGAAVANSGTSSVTITGTLAQINALFSTDLTSTVSYTDGSDNPAASATLTLAIDDGGATGGGVPLGNSDTATINITPTNDAPVATITPASYAATENAALSLKNNGLSVSDIDGNSGSETVTLSVTDGILNVSEGGSGATVTNSGTSSVTIAGTLAQINALLNTDGTSSVDYVETNDNPPASATLTLAINDNGNTGGGALTASDTATLNITSVNDAPVATITPTSYGATENLALSLKNNGLAVSDVDGNSGSETVTLSVGEGVLNVTTGGSGALVTNSGTSSVTITGTLTQINALLNTDGTSTVSYTETQDNPSASTTLTLGINDNGNTGGGALSASDTATINITPVNDAPVATITPATYSTTENTTLSLKNNGLAVSDVDGKSGSETVTLSVTDGILNVTAGGSGATVTNSGTSSVTVGGTLAQINALLNTDATSSVDYVETDDNPAASATLTLAINDNGNTGGGALTGSDTATINITAVNDAPVATITPTSYGATENLALSLKNNGLAVSDVDGNSGSETVTLSVGEGVLNVTPGGSGALVTNSGTSSVTITGTLAQINALLSTDGTSTVSYVDNNDNPAASTTLTLAVNDNGNTGGGALSASDTATINITPVNDAPVLSGLGDNPAYVENGAAVVLDTNNNASVSDAELDVSPNHYKGATLTLARNGGANPDDVFGSVGSLDLTDVSGNGDNVSLDGGATFIGRYTQPGDGSISFTFNANATAADIDSVMRQISYQNTSDNPPASAPIDFRFDDGNGESGGQAQGSGGAGITTGTITVQITQIDDAPLLSNVAISAAYSPGSSGAVLSTTNVITDPDATPPSPITGMHSATIQIANFFAGDELFVNLPSSGGHFLTGDGDPTNISASYAAGTLTLSGVDSISHYQQILDAVSYRSTAADPTNGGANPSRTITWQVNDGALNSQTPAPTVGDNPPVNETVLHFDVAPTVDLNGPGPGTGYTTTYATGNAPIAIVNNDSVTDPDTANADSMTIVLTNAMAGDSLSVAGSLPGGISSSIDTSIPGQITLRLTNSASIADYQTALAQVRFVNSNVSPNTSDRDITVVLSESGGVTSNTAHATVHVVDATPPAKPPAPDLTTATDSGVSHTDNITNVTAPTFTGNVEPGTTVRLYDSDGTTIVGTGAADAQTGAYTITSSALGQGTHHLTVTSTDASNNASVHSDALDVTIDTTPPAPTLTAADPTTTFRNTTVHYTLSFPETTFGVDPSDFALITSGGITGASITGVSEPGGPGTPYTISVSTGTGLGTLEVDLRSSGTGISDTAGNLSGGATGPVYTVADRAPVAHNDVVTLSAAQTTLTGNVLSNDSDPDGDPLRVTSAYVIHNGVKQTVAVPPSGNVALQSNHGAFTISADGSYTFTADDTRPVQNHYAMDPLVYTISDGQGASAAAQLDVHINGQQRPSTETFNYNFVNTTVSYGADGEAYLTGPDGITHNVTGVNTLIFNDGRINEGDYNQQITSGPPPGKLGPAGSSLVDDLYYDSLYHDVYLAGVDPEQHYAQYGWKEGRNPDAYFDTNYYLNQNPDVKAAGINPLDHYDTYGWKEGRNPSANFSTVDYELANPDVAAAKVDPLTHYLSQGELEGRLEFPVNAGTAGPIDGFDPSYYLANNPDVAAAGVNPFQHYLQYGWKEGRNPSADFNTNFYEAHNPDVAAAGVDPLLHYAEFGWHEGRDPAAVFSTNGYLNTYVDVAAADVNPLQHFLQYGMAEGRSPTG
jgi:VCBS repeat-containing protein